MSDGYGATAGRHCKRALTRRGEQTEYNKICTPKELAQALASNGGLRNSGVQLVGTDRSGRLAKIVESFQSCSENIADYFARANDIVYFPDDGMCSVTSVSTPFAMHASYLTLAMLHCFAR